MKEVDLVGFADPNAISDNEDTEIANIKRKTSKKSGGFQSMALSFPVLKGILKRGYKIPTPIQRKTIPLALEGRDVVAMARTGSGKTACFLIPLFEKLKARLAKSGARALILSPTRELALQTLKFIKELGKFTGLKASVVLGGDSIDDQFSAIHGNPDIIVATPGRFLHICVEMDLQLKNIEYIVFDEADRLFEMGFGEQIHEIVNRLPESRQSLLFSATLPKVLVDFAKAGLSDPVLLRLDVESKLPEGLELSFITCRPEEKLAVLLCLLKRIIKDDSQKIIFAETMHHVEYIHQILDKAGITNTFIYSNLDPSARKINAAKFQTGKVKVLIVTDVAARGIDIPHLDYVINFNFPAKSKLFVHRVGRCARAGRAGTAYNIVSADEYPYLLDLHLFLGRPLLIVPTTGSTENMESAVGKMPQTMIEEELAELINWHDGSIDLTNMQKVCNNAYQQYVRSRPGASTESVKRIKELCINEAGVFPQYSDVSSTTVNLISRMKNYRPQGTIFEIGTKTSSIDYQVMKTKRAFHKENILNFYKKMEERKVDKMDMELELSRKIDLPSSNAEEINAAFNTVVVPKKRSGDDLYKISKKRKRQTKRDEEFYVPYSAPDKHTEDGLAVNTFSTEADKAQLDLTADNEQSRHLQTQLKKWDRKKKKMITIDKNPKAGKIRTESGVWIPATYKTNRYNIWKEKSKIEEANEDDSEEESPQVKKLRTTAHTHWARHNQKLKNKIKTKNELKNPEQILKARKLLERKQKRNGRKKRKGRKARPRRTSAAIQRSLQPTLWPKIEIIMIEHLQRGCRDGRRELSAKYGKSRVYQRRRSCIFGLGRMTHRDKNTPFVLQNVRQSARTLGNRRTSLDIGNVLS
ncbi:ATP-dependent RNA helicase DDX54 isoform X2 [Odontomachus brunneus]|uniref:ATP-dependent RNA helicase DDX54 isoform X2 n=1 Tax=Odontomachus brunneus TaxID=486640 RepID=UPI0013F1ABCD|nr:ATP-dependent RNA helicase DDX54 isoform X2 [Odontomachus brunneus]